MLLPGSARATCCGIGVATRRATAAGKRIKRRNRDASRMGNVRCERQGGWSCLWRQVASGVECSGGVSCVARQMGERASSA